MKRALIIGGGFAGCAAAHQLDILGDWDVTIVEKGGYLGAGNRTMYYSGHPYTFGPRHFLTQREELFDFLNRYVPMRKCSEHQFKTYVASDDRFYNYPIHFDDVALMPERDQIYQQLDEVQSTLLHDQKLLEKNLQNEQMMGPGGAKNLEEFWKKSVGDILYTKFIENYSKKMWMVDDNTLIDDFSWSPKGVALKRGPKEAWDTAISAYPIALNGYDDYFDISTANAKVLLNTEISHFDIQNKSVSFLGSEEKFDIIVNTISPDTLFDFCFGELPFIGRDIELALLPVEYALPENVYFAYYAGNEPYTRIVEYKKFTQYKSKNTLISLEYVSKNGKHYPVPFKKEISRAQQYKDLMPDGVFSIGRAGSYEYKVDIDDTIGQAFEIKEKIK